MLPAKCGKKATVFHFIFTTQHRSQILPIFITKSSKKKQPRVDNVSSFITRRVKGRVNNISHLLIKLVRSSYLWPAQIDNSILWESCSSFLGVFRARERCSSWKVTLIYSFRYLSRLFLGGGMARGRNGPGNTGSSRNPKKEEFFGKVCGPQIDMVTLSGLILFWGELLACQRSKLASFCSSNWCEWKKW